MSIEYASLKNQTNDNFIKHHDIANVYNNSWALSSVEILAENAVLFNVMISGSKILYFGFFFSSDYLLFQLADNLNLPYRSQSFDHVLSVAVLHHFASEKRRVIALEEMFRLLSIGGTAYICVWAREQSNRNVSILEKIKRTVRV